MATEAGVILVPAVRPRVASAAGAVLPEALEAGLAQSQVPALVGLRAVAVGLVVLYHFGTPGIPGGLGVLTFFVLSGFLITWLLLKEQDATGTVSLRRFYARRALRIMPAFCVFWIVVVVCQLYVERPIIWPQALSALFYVSNYYQAAHGDPGTAFSHTWSLGVEEQFYLIWPVLFLILRSTTNRLLTGLAGTMAAVALFRMLLHLVGGVPDGYFYEAFETRADHLAVGCALAVALRRERLIWLWRALCSHPLTSLVTVGLLALSSAAQLAYGPLYRDTVGFVIDPLLIAAIIVQAIAFRQSMAWAWLNWPAVRFLGVISYSIYLYQQVVLGPVRSMFGAQPMIIQFVIATAVTIAAATVSYLLVERPFLKLKERAGVRMVERRSAPANANRQVAAAETAEIHDRESVRAQIAV